MSKSDRRTIGVTLLAIFISWALGGQYGMYIAFVCLVVGVVIMVHAHLQPNRTPAEEPFITLGNITPIAEAKAADKDLSTNVKLTPSTAGLTADPLPRTSKSFDWHSKWTELQKAFRRLDNEHVYAENGRDRLGSEIWLLGTDGIGKETLDELEALCDLAGNTLSASVPKIPLSETTSSQSKPWKRWISHVRDLQGYTQSTRYSYGKDISYEGGKIDNPAKQSALVCIKCRGTTYG